LDCAFHHYDRKALKKKKLELRKAPEESIEEFHKIFHNLAFQILEHEIDWKFLNERFQYILHIFENLHILASFEPLPAYLGVRASKSNMDKVVVTSDRLSSSHQAALAPQCEVGEGVHASIELSHPSTPPSLDICGHVV